MSGKDEFLKWAKGKPWTLPLGHALNASDCPIGRFLAETQGRRVVAVLPDRIIWWDGEEPLDEGLQQVVEVLDSSSAVDTPVTRLGVEYRVEHRTLREIFAEAMPSVLEEIFPARVEFDENDIVQAISVMLSNMTLNEVKIRRYHSSAGFEFRSMWSRDYIERSLGELLPHVEKWFHKHERVNKFQLIRLIS